MSDQNTNSSSGGDGDDSRADQLRREASKAADAARSAATGAIKEIKVASNQLVDRVRDLIEEGNVRHIAVKRGDRTLLEIPLTVGVGAGAAAVFISPVLAAVGAFAALVSEITIVVEREDEEAGGGKASGGKADAKADSEKTVGRSGSGGGSGSGGSNS